MSDERARRYDTFVVRLWRDVVSRRLIRADVEHVQSGQRAERRWRPQDGNEPDGLAWITDQIRAGGMEESPGKEASDT